MVIIKSKFPELQYSSADFIEKSSGIKQRYVIDAKNICDELSLDFKYIFENSISCYTGDGCGKCGACTDRILAFEKAGIEDVTKYKEV